MTPKQIIAHLNLEPHPEGGWYRQTWIESHTKGRPAGTAIYYLLDRDQASHWHKVDATEIWHFYAGAPLAMRLSETEAGPARDVTLGSALVQSQSPQVIVPMNSWQSARSLGDWTLVGCTVSPGFRFEGFTLAPPGFDIPSG